MLHLEFPALTCHAAPARQMVMNHLRHKSVIELLEDQAFDFELAIGEALANAIQHGSPLGKENHICIHVRASRGVLRVEVSDEGEGFDASPEPSGPALMSERGRGCFLMRQLAAARWTNNGSTVTLSRDLGGSTG